MTEAEWLTGTDPWPMIEFLHDGAKVRKPRLFACACCRRAWHLVSSAEIHAVIRVAEDHADGLEPDANLSTALRTAHRALLKRDSLGKTFYDAARYGYGRVSIGLRGLPQYIARSLAYSLEPNPSPRAGSYFDGRQWVTEDIPEDATRRAWDNAFAAELAVASSLLRDIFGNPFRPVSVDPDWRTATVVALARGVYDERAFDRMPLLADALEDAGCGNDAILTHCRGGGPHARGCWVVDLVLGKE